MSFKKILGILLITIIALAGVVGYIGFSLSDSDAKIGISTLTDNITQSGSTFSGTIQLEQEIFIYNSGVLDFKDIEVNVTVYFTVNIDTTEVEVGDGLNQLGSVAAGENESKIITIEITNRIPKLAVEDGTLRIVINTNLELQYIPYTIELPQQESFEAWDAPFNPL